MQNSVTPSQPRERQATPSIRRNYIYNTALTVLNIVFPVITFSYVARVFGPEIVGRVSFAFALVNFLVLAATLGVPAYGAREIARTRDDTNHRDSAFTELFLISLVSSTFITVGYVLAVFLLPSMRGEPHLFLVVGLHLVFSSLGVDWFFQGIENYRYIAMRNIAVRCGVLASVFLLVRTGEDYLTYAFLGVFGIVGSYTLSFSRVLSLVDLRRPSLRSIRRHLSSALLLFGSAATASVYVYLDTVILGVLCDDRAVGLYSAAIRVCRMSLSLLTSVGVVLIPRLSYYVRKDMAEEYLRTGQKSVDFLCFVSFPMTTLIFVLAPAIVSVLAGDSFMGASRTLRVAVWILPVIAFTNFLGQQVFIANGEEKKLFISTLLAAVVSIVGNLLLAPRFGSIGTATAVLLAEVTVLVTQLMLSRREYLPFRMYSRAAVNYTGLSVLLGGAVLLATRIVHSPIAQLFALAPTALLTYGLVLVACRDSLAIDMLHSVLNKLRTPSQDAGH